MGADGKAVTWFKMTSLRIAENETVLEVLAEQLRAKYGRRESASQIFVAVMQHREMPDDTSEEFSEALEDLGLYSTLEENQYVEAFSNGVAPLIRASQAARVPEKVIEACRRAYRMDGNDRGASEKTTRPVRHVEYANGGANGEEA